MRTFIAGVGHYLPERVVTSEELEIQAGYERFGLKPGLCLMLSGCKTRHYAAPDEACSDLATKACAEAMEDAGVTADEIDAVIFGSVTQDFAEPATANRVACNLGIQNSFVFDVKNACNAFLQGLDIADSLIRTEKAGTVLVVSGEVFSRWVKLECDNRQELQERAPVALTLSDAAGAFVIKESPTPDRGIMRSYFHTTPELWDNNVMWGGGVIYPRDPEKMYVPGTTRELIRALGTNVDTLAPLTMEKLGLTYEDVDYFSPTQVASWIVRFAEKHTPVRREQLIDVIDHVGNAGASNIPIALYEARKQGLIEPGTRLLLSSAAVGMSFAAMSVVM